MEQLPAVNDGRSEGTWTPDMVRQFAPSNQDRDTVIAMAEGYMRVINESLALAVRSKVPATKASRLIVAKTKLDELELHLTHYPFITLQGAEKMRAQIDQLNDEFTEAGYFDPALEKRPRRRKPADEVISVWRYIANLDPSTPLAALEAHWSTHPTKSEPRPIIGAEGCGAWLQWAKPWRELGIDVDEDDGTMASPVGPVPMHGGDYLEFLIALRRIAEADAPEPNRRARLGEVLDDSRWARFTNVHGRRRLLQQMLAVARRQAAS